MKRLAVLFVFSVLAFAPAAEAQYTWPWNVTSENHTGYLVGTHAELQLISAAINKAFWEIAWVESPWCIENQELYCSPDGLLEAPFTNYNATHMVAAPWGVSEGMDCLEVTGLNYVHWGHDFYPEIMGTTRQVDVDSSSGVELLDVAIPPMTALVSMDDVPQACKDKVIQEQCTWWMNEWVDRCAGFFVPNQLCCDLIVAFPNQPNSWD